MALMCSCGWVGGNLIPYPTDNTARCPSCRRVFKGIPASDAIVPGVNDEEIRRGLAFVQALGDAVDRDRRCNQIHENNRRR